MSKKEKTTSAFQMFVLVIFIPVIFGIIFFSVILNIIGFDVWGQAKQVSSSIPYVSSLFKEEEELEVEMVTTHIEASEEQQNEISSLEQQLSERNERVRELETEKLELEQKLLVEQEMSNRATKELTEIAKTYEAMSAKNAAAILSELQTEEALLHLSQLSTDSRAAILAKMEASRAADLMSRLTNQ
jgi:flagellar motility protein MotE (MotC chaperone)